MAIGGMRGAREFLFEFAAFFPKRLVLEGKIMMLLFKLMAMAFELMAVSFELTAARLEPTILFLQRRDPGSRPDQLVQTLVGAGFQCRQQGRGTFIVQGMPLHARLTIVGRSCRIDRVE